MGASDMTAFTTAIKRIGAEAEVPGVSEETWELFGTEEVGTITTREGGASAIGVGEDRSCKRNRVPAWNGPCENGTMQEYIPDKAAGRASSMGRWVFLLRRHKERSGSC